MPRKPQRIGILHHHHEAAEGVPGPPGEQGAPGTPGADGYTPIKGVDYFDGEPGADGAQGIQGIPGQNGTNGLDGAEGEQGIQGIQGPAGNDGATGAPGPNQVTTSTTTNITGLLKGNGSTVAQASAPTDYVATGDSRLSDARTPTTHSHPESEVTNLVTDLAAKQVTLVSGTNIKTVNSNSLLGSGDLVIAGAGMPLISNTICSALVGNQVWTNMPAALSFWYSSATVCKSVRRIDLTNYVQARLRVVKLATAGAAASKLILRYKTSTWTQTVANYSDIGTSEVSVAVNVQNTFLDTGWINLAAGAKADVFVVLVGSGGDGALDPVFGDIVAEFQ